VLLLAQTDNEWSGPGTLSGVIPDPVETIDAWRAGRLAELVNRVLEPLLGEPFMALGRAADMMWLGFGDVVFAPTPRSRSQGRTSRHPRELPASTRFRCCRSDRVLGHLPTATGPG
jgi:hypothetical protein